MQGLHLDFTVTLQGIATVFSILTVGWGIVKSIDHLKEAISVTHWEHKVMWWYWSKENPAKIPTYPELPKEG